jgi:hypothetical protein
MSDSQQRTERTLLATTDAMVWAEEFCRIFAGYTVWEHDEGHDGIDAGLMVAWFASAIETGRNFGRKETCSHEDTFSITDDMSTCRDCGFILQAMPVEEAEEIYDDDEDDVTLEESFVEGFQEGR